jgi:AcrR family transcriptional regulator
LAIQQRAERTKELVLRAAARAFDVDGYERTSLSRISERAKVTTGAVVFHFGTKANLAEAVRRQARTVTRRAIESAAGGRPNAVEKLMAVTRTLIDLLESDDVVRAAERLARELAPQGIQEEKCPWRREVARLSRAADAEGLLRPGVDAMALAALVSYVVSGVELAMRRPRLPADEPWLGEAGALDGAAHVRLERIWHLVLPALEPAGGRRERPGPEVGSPSVQEASGQQGQGMGDALVRDAQGVPLVVVELWGQRSHGDVGKRVGIADAARYQQGAHMEAPEGVGAGGVASRAGFGAQSERQMPLQ